MEDPADPARLRSALDRAESALSRSRQAISQLEPGNFTVTEWQEACAAVGTLLAEFDVAANEVNAAFGLTSPQERILTYFRDRIGQVVGKHELRGVAAIYEWARRIRELRIDQGWPISSYSNRPDLRPGQYILEAGEPNDELLHDWTLARRTRELRISPKNRGLEYLKALCPRAATKDQLAYVMQIQSYAEHLRDLEEEGWHVQSNVDDPTLPSGSFRLVSLDLRPPRVRQLVKLRYQILDRDEYACRDCERTPTRDSIPLEVHRVRPAVQRGDNEPRNLITLCSECHAERHGVAMGATQDDLLGPGSEPPSVVR